MSEEEKISIKTPQGVVKLGRNTADLTAQAIRMAMHGRGWIEQVAKKVGVLPVVVLGVDDWLRHLDKVRRKSLQGDSPTPISPAGPAESESTPPATDNKPEKDRPKKNEGHNGTVWSR